MMRLITPLLIFLYSGPGLAFIKPGELSPGNLPRLRSEATVVATAIADDGSIFLLGDFDEVDGIPRPGLAKLTSNGHLDPSFKPQIGVEMKIQIASGGILSPTLTPITGPDYDSSYHSGFNTWWEPKPRHLDYPETDLFALNEGRLFVRRGNAWVILAANGSIDELAFPGFDRIMASMLPQFLLGERLIALTSDDRLVALDLAQGDTLDPDFNLDPRWTGTILQSVPARSSKLWVLSQRDQFKVVCRLNADGSMDDSFPPLELRDGQHYKIEPGTSGGFILTDRIPYHNIRTTCHRVGGCIVSALKNEKRIQWFDEIGILKGQVRNDLGFSGRSLLQAHPLYRAVFFNDARQVWESQNTSGTVTPFPEFPIASPNDSSTLPLVFQTLDLIKGRFGNSLQSSLVGGTRLYLWDRTLDPNRHIPRLTRQAINLKARVFPDGSLLIAGDFNQAGQWSCRGMIRLTLEGQLDQTFAPDLDLRFTKEFEVLPDGRIFILLDRPWTSPDGEQHSLLALSPEGKVERGYSTELNLSNNPQIELLEDGSLLIEQGLPMRNLPLYPPFLVAFRGSTLQRILPSGEVDEDWPLSHLEDPGFYSSQKLLALKDGTFLWGVRHYDAKGILIQTINGAFGLGPIFQDDEGSVFFTGPPSNFYPNNQLHRWKGGSDLDPSFVSGLTPSGNNITGVHAGSRGKLLVSGRIKTPSGIHSLVRMHASGQIDYTFNPPPLRHHLLPSSTTSILTTTGLQPYDLSQFSSRSSPGILIANMDRILAGGSFGETHGNFINLADSHLAGYRDWISNATGEHHLPENDFDQDGRTNLQEYALGTNPIHPDNHIPEFRRSSLPPLRFQLVCNPDAPKVRRSIAVSTDLIDWEIGTAHHFTTEPGPGCLNLRMTQSEHRLFLRTRYSLP